MDFLDSKLTHFGELEIAFRLILASAFGAVVGFEREIANRPAGLRTHMLVSLAAALFTIVTFEIFYAVRTLDEVANMDPIRLVEAVTAGVAFLAAGTIIHAGGKVEGLTTGAGMWLAGALGLACGAGLYTIALMGAVLTMIILSLLKVLEARLLKSKNLRRDRSSKQ